jgi:hypothetical protein
MHTLLPVILGAVVPILLMIVLLIEALATPSLSSWRDLTSLFSTGRGDWVRIFNFFLSGLLIIGPAVGLLRRQP